MLIPPWAALGYDQKAAEEAKKALDASSDRDREQHLAVEGHYYETVRNWTQAIENYRALWAFAPDNAEYGLSLAECQAATGQAKEALGTVEELRKLPPPPNNDPESISPKRSPPGDYRTFKRALAASLHVPPRKAIKAS